MVGGATVVDAPPPLIRTGTVSVGSVAHQRPTLVSCTLQHDRSSRAEGGGPEPEGGMEGPIKQSRNIHHNLIPTKYIWHYNDWTIIASKVLLWLHDSIRPQNENNNLTLPAIQLSAHHKLTLGWQEMRNFGMSVRTQWWGTPCGECEPAKLVIGCPACSLAGVVWSTTAVRSVLSTDLTLSLASSQWLTVELMCVRSAAAHSPLFTGCTMCVVCVYAWLLCLVKTREARVGLSIIDGKEAVNDGQRSSRSDEHLQEHDFYN